MNDVAMLDHITALTATLAAADKQSAEKLAPAFSPFAFMETDELGLSRLIGWLINPSGSHAQGASFLDAFVRHLGIPWQPVDCAAAQITLEAPTPRLTEFRRIDVLVESHGRAIAIENKPTAADQARQVQDYFTHLDQHYPLGGYLIYLSRNGTGPSPFSIPPEEAERRTQSRQLLVLGYVGLLPWLETCRSLCLASRINSFISDFETYIRRRFNGERTVTTHDQLVTDFVTSPTRLASALNVIAAADALRLRLIGRLQDDIRTEAAGRGWTLLPEIRSTIQWSGFSILFGGNDELKFRVEFGDERRSSCCFGVWGMGPGHKEYAPVGNLLTSAFGRGREHHVSPWHRNPRPQEAPLPIEDNWFNSDAPWRAIADGTMAPKIIAAAQSFHDVLAPQGYVGRRLP
ncbi:PD-(D/E)XK nuclease family protein [Bosea sp. 2RAB26]|uniref:PDDEXK-like family protein n=1 Tax=Bosea sp. 2RAB26 TaxID=3237476 RepID=UPI003F90FE62